MAGGVFPTSARSGRAVTGIFSGVQVRPMGANFGCFGVRSDLPVFIANTWNTRLDVSGRGALNFLAVHAYTTTGARTISVRLTIDGNVVLSPTFSIPTGACLAELIGNVVIASDGTYTGMTPIHHPEYFDSSCKLEVMNSNTEGGAVMIYSHLDITK